jgi:hypothetical protein
MKVQAKKNGKKIGGKKSALPSSFTPDLSARKSPATKRQRPTLPASLADLHEDPHNPRTIEAEASAALGTSLDEFGDISGIVFNVRPTKEAPHGSLVTGHQRVDQLRAQHGELNLDVGNALRGVPGDREAWLVTPKGDRFRVRLVDWPRKKHVAAMLAANSSALAGDWTDGLGLLLEEVKADNRELFDSLLLDQLATSEASAADSSDPAGESVDVPEVFQLVIELKSEKEQQRWFKKLEAEGLSVKVQTM